MNFNPQNEQGLLGVVAALKNGMDPGTAYSIYQNLQQDQAQQIAQRQQRLSGLADLLTGSAMQGMPYAGAQALAEAAPGPAGPAVQNMLQALYPAGEAALPTNASGAVMDFPSGSRPTTTGVTPEGYGVPMAGPQSTSPAFVPPAPSMGEQVQAQQLQQQQELQALWQEFTTNAQSYAASGRTREQFLLDAAKAYPELFGSDIQTVQQIVLTIFAQPTQP